MTYKSTILADSPLGYWRLGEASGSVANDEIGPHNHDGSYGSAVTLAQAAIIKDTDTCVLMSAASNNNFALLSASGDTWGDLQTFSMEVWFVPTTGVGQTGMVVNKSGDAAASAWSAQIRAANNGGALTLRFRMRTSEHGGDSDDVTVINPYTAGTPAHLAAVKNGTADTIKWYVNGVLKFTGNSGTLVFDLFGHNGTLILGRLTAGSGNYRGRLDEAAYYNTALSVGQLAAHYAAGVSIARALALPLPLESAAELTARLPLPLEAAGILSLGHGLPLPLESAGWRSARALPLPIESAGWRVTQLALAMESFGLGLGLLDQWDVLRALDTVFLDVWAVTASRLDAVFVDQWDVEPQVLFGRVDDSWDVFEVHA